MRNGIRRRLRLHGHLGSIRNLGRHTGRPNQSRARPRVGLRGGTVGDAAVRPADPPGRGAEGAGTAGPPRDSPPAPHRGATGGAVDAIQSARRRVAVGSQPDRVAANQCLLHARRQDRVLQRHPRHPQADRRRGRDRDGARDGACAARTRTRTGGQDAVGPDRHRHRVDRRGAARLRRPRRAGGIRRRPTHPAQVRPRRRDRSGPGRPRTGGTCRFRSARRRDRVAEDGGRRQGAAAAVALQPSFAWHPRHRDHPQPRPRHAALRPGPRHPAG